MRAFMRHIDADPFSSDSSLHCLAPTKKIILTNKLAVNDHGCSTLQLHSTIKTTQHITLKLQYSKVVVSNNFLHSTRSLTNYLLISD